MNLFTALTNWSEWAALALSEAEVAERYAEELAAKLKALNNVANASAKTVTAAKAKMYEDEHYLAAQEQYMAKYADRKAIGAVSGSLDRKSALISRELSRRLGRNDRDNRESRWTP